jgi:hypothetical protein
MSDSETEAEAPACLLGLPNELLDAVLDCLSLDVCAGLAGTCSTLRAYVEAPEFISRRCSDSSVAAHNLSLRRLAVVCAMRAVPRRVFHDFGHFDVTPAARDGLAQLADVVRRYQLRVTVHSHDDGGPEVIANLVSQQRAQAVREVLVTHGVRTHLRVTGWGNRVAAAAGWRPTYDQSEADSARSELFVEMSDLGGTLCIPPLPAHYDGLEPPPQDALGAVDDEQDEEEEEEDDDYSSSNDGG